LVSRPGCCSVVYGWLPWARRCAGWWAAPSSSHIR